MTSPLEYRPAEHTAGPTEDELDAMDEYRFERTLEYFENVVIEPAPDVPGIAPISEWLWWWNYRERTDIPLW